MEKIKKVKEDRRRLAIKVTGLDEAHKVAAERQKKYGGTFCIEGPGPKFTVGRISWDAIADFDSAEEFTPPPPGFKGPLR